MTDACPQNFDQSLLSGHIDGELRQFDEQKVNNHLADCANCRDLCEQMLAMREAAMTTRFQLPDDGQWSEAPKSAMSLGALHLGWLLVIVWAVALGAFCLWHLWQTPTNLLEKSLVFGGISGFALLFISVLMDRLKSARNDPYREVKK